MTIKSNISKEKDFLRIEAKGRQNTLSGYVLFIRSIIESALAHKSRKVLLDNRDVTFTADTYDNKLVVSNLESVPLSKTIKTARLERFDQYGPAKLFETLAVNRSFNIRAFTSEEEALEWLLN